jgi:hypothetical protein
MAHDLQAPKKQSTSEFWRAYFAKFRRRVEDHETSETGPAPLSEMTERPASPPSRTENHPRR